jgi:hypothetical protein
MSILQLVFQVTGIVGLPDDGAQAAKHVAECTKCMYTVDIAHLVGIKNVSEDK